MSTRLSKEELTQLMDGLKHNIMDGMNNYFKARLDELKDRDYDGPNIMHTSLLAVIHCLFRMIDREERHTDEIVKSMLHMTDVTFELLEKIKYETIKH